MNIAHLINALFQLRLKEDGTEYTNQEIAKQLGFDASYLSKLRRGIITNPGRDTLIGLSQFFNVPITYFFPEVENTGLPPDVQVSVALRSSGLDEDQQSRILDIINMIRGRKNDNT